MAAIATPVVLGTSTIAETAGSTGFTEGALAEAFADLVAAEDPFEKGVGLLYARKYGDAAALLAVALKQRQRQLTRIPSEIYPAAMLEGLALFRAGKFDNSAVAYLTALEQRPSDQAARKLRAEALTRVGKADAVGR
jgi:tetratricopeptide (TPR) repeat protein